MELIGILILLYIFLCCYTLFIWVTLVNRIRQKRYNDAIYRSLGFLVLYSLSTSPFLLLASIADVHPINVVLASSVFLIIASLFSTSSPKTTKNTSIIVPYQPITLEEISEVTTQVPIDFAPKALVAPREIKLLEQQSDLLWSNYVSTFPEKFWQDYEKVLIQMKSLH